MEKDILKDVVPPAHKRSIRDIPIPGKKGSTSGNDINLSGVKKEEPKPQPEIEQVDRGGPNDFDNEFEYEGGESQRNYKPFIIIAVVVVALFVIVLIMNIFAKATVTIQPKTTSASVDDVLSVVDINNVTDQTQLGYRTLEFEKEDSLIVEASGEETIQEKSSGTIRVYNEYSEKDQKLIKNTRFEASNGNIYRVQSSITVPGYTEIDGQIVPGTLEVEVFADEAGDQFNLSSGGEFTIPGFEGQEQYDFFYAKSVTSISGGFDGTRKIVSESDFLNAEESLKNNLVVLLKTEVLSQLPNNLVPIYHIDSFTFDPVTQTDSGSDKVKISTSAKVSVNVIDKGDLSEKIAENNLAGYIQGNDILVINFNELDIRFIIEDLEDGTSRTSIGILGEGDFVWQIDNSDLSKSLLGVKRSGLAEILQSYPGIDRANAVISPFWKRSFPDDIEKIFIEEENVD